MRRYELMLLFRPDLEDDKLQSAVEKVTRAIVNAGGALTKVSPWGKRRMAYEIQHFREASYFLLHFDIPPSAIREIERGLLISEEILRHLVTVLEDRGEGQGDEDVDGGEAVPMATDRIERYGEVAAGVEPVAIATEADAPGVATETDATEVATEAEPAEVATEVEPAGIEAEVAADDVAEATIPAATTGRSRRVAKDEES
jgi:small subunit ribosomal protein S6